MIVLAKILQTLLPVLYGFSTLGYLLYFFNKSAGLKRTATATLCTGAVLHLTYVISLGLLLGRHPMATIFEFLSFVAMSMAFIYLFLEVLHRNAFIGAFVAPAIFLLQFGASVGVDMTSTMEPILKEVRFALHATLFAVAYAAFIQGVLFALMVLLFERSIRRHRFGIIFEQLPSLDVLAKMTATTMWVGFGFMTAGLFLGTWNAVTALSQFHLDPKIVLTGIVWILYGAAIFSRYVLRWSDRSTAIFSIVGFILLALSTMAGHVATSSWHNFVGQS